MKTTLIYGLLLAVIGALLLFGMYFAGFHDSPEKMSTGQWIGGVIGVTVSVICYVLAIRQRRAEYPPDREWTYGSALGAGVLTGLWASLIGTIFSGVYFFVVNPQFGDVVYQLQVQKMEAGGRSAAQISQAEGFMRIFVSPTALTISQALNGFIISVLLCLIIAIFLRKRAGAPDVAAVDPATPPAIG